MKFTDCIGDVRSHIDAARFVQTIKSYLFGSMTAWLMVISVACAHTYPVSFLYVKQRKWEISAGRLQFPFIVVVVVFFLFNSHSF